MQVLDKGDQSHSGFNHVVHSLSSFVHEGLNGRHVCIVYPAMGESLSFFQARMAGHKLPIYLMKRVSRQLLQALDYTHECGLIHTGTKLVSHLASLLIF